MNARKRATIYLDADLHRALRFKAAATERSFSGIVNEAVRRSLVEDAIDLTAIETRAPEPVVGFAIVVKRLKWRCQL